MTGDIIVKRKVFAYITHRCRLLVFRRVDVPEAGIQVPAGTVEPGESPSSAVMREAREETALVDLHLVRFLGDPVCAMHDSPESFPARERHHGFFFHLRCLGAPPATWRHEELHEPGGAADPIVFGFFWVELPDGVPPLIAGHDWFVSRLEC
jgi:ADP-ribose pyrophosphatase YjhB (NUDIX family)